VSFLLSGISYEWLYGRRNHLLLIVVLQDGIAMKHVDLVKDFKNKTILNK